MSTGSEEGMLQGVEMAIGQMKVEESARVIVGPKYGFGQAGNAEKDIPGDATLVYFVRLNSFEKVLHSHHITCRLTALSFSLFLE